MRSMLAASPLSLGAPVLRFERVERDGSLCDGEPKHSDSGTLYSTASIPSIATNPGWGSGLPENDWAASKALPIHRPVDKLGNFFSR